MAWLVFVFLLGGSSRGDVLPLLLLRPLSVLALAYGLSQLTREQIRENRFLLGMAAAWLVLPLLQLVPLPPSVWHELPGREIVGDIDRQAGLGDVWRPLSMVPYATLDAAWALLAPLATLVLGIQVEEGQRKRLLLPVILLGFLSAAIGVLQMIGDPNGPLYFYKFTHNGTPVGLLANRNHQAAFLACLMPMLAAWASIRAAGGERGFFGSHRGFLSSRALQRWLPPFLGAAIAVPLILTTGSRSGSILGILALVSLPIVVSAGMRSDRSQRDAGQPRAGYAWVSWLFLAALVALAVLTAVLGRAISLNRATSLDASLDERLLALPVVLSLTKAYLPWGSGLGTFEQVYYVREPDNLLTTAYFNHAHNDWLELVLTGGVPAVVLAVIGLAGFAGGLVRLVAIRREKNASLPIALTGLIVMVVFGLASITDYPLRVPSLACLAVLAVLWFKTAHIRAKPGPVHANV